MSQGHTATAVSLLVSCATVAMLAAPGLADERDSSLARAATNIPPIAVDDTASVSSGGSVLIPVLDNDSDPDASSSTAFFLDSITSPPATGSADLADGGITYTAAADHVGTDQFSYAVSDGELTAEAVVTVTVTSTPNQSPAPTADQGRTRWGSPLVLDVLANDTDPDGDSLRVLGVRRPEHGRAELVRGMVRYVPRGKYVGSDTLEYTVADGRGGTAAGTAEVRVRPRFDVTLKRTSTPIALQAMDVRGVLSTRLDGPVTVKLQRRSEAGRWFTVRERRVRGDDSFSLSWKPGQPGATVVRLRATWAGGHHNTSAIERLRVEARFSPTVSRVTAKDVPHTWRPGCPVPPSGLRKIQMNYWDYKGQLQRGTLIGAAYVTSHYLAIFRRAFTSRFAIKKMYPADRFGGVDERAMRAGNTSAFNCRHVTGNPYRMSQHSYGNAIDINTFENPYVTGSKVYPPKAAVPYYYRRQFHLQDPGVITSRSPIARELWRQGWAWGARWGNPDYQHWSSNGG